MEIYKNLAPSRPDLENSHWSIFEAKAQQGGSLLITSPFCEKT